ncbi:hypothetical protein PAESOLCIP111_04758 [Paenibacillus solanacearum]|uniref:Uncharacterized protein n=1 Tax=Paenibacillus solanacearum TaxID=2048548 RepID=A0A916K4V5_9BACL|nr:hypothetical protein [Paenibacillus solanacearum]CAG7644650.1 hypothetical protein PAESOLCIP111_04758 [Paenibacillus solanacearum]
MEIAILSPCLLKAEKEDSQKELEHYKKLEDLIRILFQFTKLKFEYYRRAPYEGYKMDIPNYQHNLTLNNLVTVNIYSVIQKMMIRDYVVDLDGIPPATKVTDFKLPDGDMTEAFLSYINFSKNKKPLLFIGEENFNIPRPIHFSEEDNFEIDASTLATIELSNILSTCLNDKLDVEDIFPRKFLCSKYNDYVKKKIETDKLDSNGSIALFQQLGALVAEYNCYEKDNYLSKKNSTKDKLRTVYKKTIGKESYLSFDVESGGFEVFNHNFEHLGQYNFNCQLVKPPSPHTHRLYR